MTCPFACPNFAPTVFCDKAEHHVDEHEGPHPKGGRMYWPNMGPFPGSASGLREELAALAERVAALEQKSSAAGPDRGGPARQVLVNALDEARRERDQERAAKMRAEEQLAELRERLERIGVLAT